MSTTREQRAVEVASLRPMRTLTTRTRGQGSTLLWSVVLTGAVFVQAPGRLVGDTKLDLSIDPSRFMSQSLHLWQPQAAFGQLQNQAYGYLFPMGPFFALGHALGAPGWVVQRLWQSALLIVAFQGMRVLAGRLGIGTPATRTIGGLAFCLSPWMLAHIGPISIEALPTCVAPWVLVPLVGTEAVERPRRAAALSGLALLFAGGVNATATLALLVLPVLLFVTGERGLARRRLAGYWGVAVFLAMAWWLLPLVVLGRYSPPFLTWIESATGTTNTTSIPAALFGTSDWVGHLDTLAGPWWPAGWTLSHAPFALAGEALIVGLGVVGLIHRSMPYRRFLAVGALVGLALITVGHGELATSPLAPTARTSSTAPWLRSATSPSSTWCSGSRWCWASSTASRCWADGGGTRRSSPMPWAVSWSPR